MEAKEASFCACSEDKAKLCGIEKRRLV